MTEPATQINKIAELNSTIDSLLASLGQNDLFAYISPIFEKYKDLSKLEVYGWTPSFNDGDPCTFSVSAPNIYFGDDLPLSEDYEDDTLPAELSNYHYADTKYKSDADDINLFIVGIPDQVWGKLFGEYGFKATITRDGIVIDPYYCE